MKAKTILAMLLVAAAASADARLASPFPRKPLPPEEIGCWIVINGNPWSHEVKSEHRIPTPFVGHETAVNSSKLLSDSRFEALLPRLASVASK